MRYFFAALVVLTALLLIAIPSTRKRVEAGYYGSYGSYFHYYPTGYPTLPTYTYYNYQPTYGYNTPFYDGNYHYHNAGYYKGTYYPAGNYAWRNGGWVAQPSYNQTPPNWKSQLLELAKAREEYKEFNDALKSMGLTGTTSGFSQPNFSNYTNANANLGTYGANGSTIYGYSYSTVKDLYGSTDLNTLFQQAQRLAQNAQTLGSQATQDFQTAVSQEGNNRSRVAEILAKGQAASQALQSAQGNGITTTSTTTQFKIDNGKQIQSTTNQTVPRQQQTQAASATQQGQARITPEFAQLATIKCLKCHGADKNKIEGKFDVRNYPDMSVSDKEKVWQRLMTKDEGQLMPKGGPPLTAEEKRVFFTN